MESHYHPNFEHSDARGTFSKFWAQGNCKKCDSEFFPQEAFYSTSSRGVIRGFHFQKQPDQISKLVKVIEGEILDVSFSLDSLRSDYEFEEYFLNSKSPSLFVPDNYAHAFQVLSDSATVMYLTSGLFSSVNDSGLHWSIYSKWNDLPKRISERDQQFPKEFGI